MNKRYAVGVDVGGSHVTSAVIDLDQKTILSGTLSGKDVDTADAAGKIIRSWAENISTAIAKSPAPVSGIGIAMPGPFDYSNGIALLQGLPKFSNLFGLNVRQALQTELDISMPVRFINDASAFAIGESFAGSGEGFRRLLVITLGTGFGSAFLDNGIPVLDRNDVPGKGYVYHLAYKDGIADEYFSTRWFVTRYKELTGKEVKGVRELADRVETDRVARDLFNEFGYGLGKFLSPWLRSFKADAMVAGGNISRSWSIFGESFKQALEEENISIVTAVSELKEHAALLGSARLLEDTYWYRIRDVIKGM